MLAVVKMPRTKENFEVRGNIPEHLIKYLQREYGNRLCVTDDEEEYVNIEDTAWHKKMEASWTPGRSVKTYRLRDNLTQTELGKKLGGLSNRKISDIENNRRGISKNLAIKLAKLFGTSVESFLSIIVCINLLFYAYK